MTIKIVKPEEQGSENFEIFVGVLGYESRCTKVSVDYYRETDKGFYIELPDFSSDAYFESQKIYERAGFTSIGKGVDEALMKLKIYLQGLPEGSRIAVDVTSMPRAMAASIVRLIFHGDSKSRRVSFFYCPAKYNAPIGDFSPVSFSGPILPDYAGWTLYPDKPPTAIIGLGYEFDRAIGVLDYLDVDISNSILLMPISIDQKYDHAVKKSNKLLLSQVKQEQIVHYRLDSPEDTLVRLNSIISSLSKDNRVIIVPFGPKLLSTISLVAAEMQPNDVTVWRVSGGQHELPVDRKPSNNLVRLDIDLNI